MSSYRATKGFSLHRDAGRGLTDGQIGEMAEVCELLADAAPDAPNVARLRAFLADVDRVMAEWEALSPMLEAAGRGIENNDDEQLARAALVEV